MVVELLPTVALEGLSHNNYTSVWWVFDEIVALPFPGWWDPMVLDLMRGFYLGLASYKKCCSSIRFSSRSTSRISSWIRRLVKVLLK